MLSKQHRFHGHKSLGFVYRRGSTVRNQCMALKFVHNTRRNDYRAAVVVGRKVHKSAVARNRVRRRLYEIIRAHESEVTAPYDILLTVFSDSVAEMPSTKLERSVVELLLKAGITKKPTPKKSSLPPRAIVKEKEDNS